MRNIPYLAFNDFVFRSPLFAFNRFLYLLSKISYSEDSFKELFRDKLISEAIYVATPDLYFELKKYLKNENINKKEICRLKYALLKYLCRMSTRCTPFGLFAGCSTGKIDDQSCILLAQLNDYVRHTRLDMNYIYALTQDIVKINEIKVRIKYFPNNSIYRIGDKLRFVEYYFKNTKRVYKISEVDWSEYLEAIFDKANSGSYYEDIVNFLISMDIYRNEAKEFVDELISSQLIVSELEPSITGLETLDYIVSKLSQINSHSDDKIKSLTGSLERIKKLLLQIDAKPLGSCMSIYNKVILEIANIGTQYDKRYLFQVDLSKPAKRSNLNKEILNDIRDGILFLNKISIPPAKTQLSDFRDRFYDRYADSEMPLLFVLDNETGIGYDNQETKGDINTLIDDLSLPNETAGIDNSNQKLDKLQLVLLKKYMDVISKKKDCLELEDSDFGDVNPRWDDLPDTISVLCSIIRYNDNVKEILMNASGNSSAANLLGRFCHIDPEIKLIVDKIIQKEEEVNKECIYAEIVHLPESRIGNVLLRPILRKYEIPYLVRSAVEKYYTIELNDLMVSVQNGRVILRSKRLNKEIIPRLSTAHNYSVQSMPVYHFLCDMQLQNKRAVIQFHWGFLRYELNWLPRVKYKNIILSPAMWRIYKKEIEPFLNIESDIELIEAFDKWRESINLPAFVTCNEGDNKLFIDLENPLSIRTLFAIMKKRTLFELEEFLFDIDNAIVKSEEGVFTNEFIFSFYKSQ